jgi:hypothetical protein
MATVTVTTRLHMQVRRLLKIIADENSGHLDTAFVLLFEQYVCAILQESLSKSDQADVSLLLSQLLEKPENAFFQQLSQGKKVAGHWVNELLAERADLLAEKDNRQSHQSDLISVSRVSTNFSDYQRWLSLAEAFMNSVREYNQEY